MYLQHMDSMKPKEPPRWDWGAAVEDADARIRDTVVRTPLRLAPDLVPGFRGKLALKAEQDQRTGSFKLRGAANRIAVLSPDEARAGVTTSSMGNHGLGVAWAARALGVPVEVFVSSHVPPERTRRMQDLGATVTVVGDSVVEAERAARRAGEERGMVYVSPYNDPWVVAGQGTVAKEVLEDFPDVDAVFVAVGGGGLVSGIGSYLKARASHVEVVGCWPENAPALHACLEARHIHEVPERPTVSESTAGGIEEGAITFELARDTVDRSVLVSEEEILAAMRLLRDTIGWTVEGAAGVALAAFLRERAAFEGRNVAVVLCGGNLSDRVRARLG